MSLDLFLSDSFVHFEGTGNNRQCLTLNITNDNDGEGNKEVILILEVVNTTQPFYMDIKPSSMIVEIIDDDSELLIYSLFSYISMVSKAQCSFGAREQTIAA